jgi:hypothetical protein
MSLEIMLYLLMYTYWRMHGLPLDDPWKIRTSWRCAVLIKLNIGILQLVGYNKLVYQIMQGIIIIIIIIIKNKFKYKISAVLSLQLYGSLWLYKSIQVKSSENRPKV